MTNSYHNDSQAELLGGILTSDVSLHDLPAAGWTQLRQLNLEKTANQLLSLFDADGGTLEKEILTAAFLGDVAVFLTLRLQQLEYPDDTPKPVLLALADALIIKSGLVGDEIQEINDYMERMDGYNYEDQDYRLQRLSSLKELYDWLLEAFKTIGGRIPGHVHDQAQHIINRFSFWQSSGYTADYLYLEGLSDELMASSYLRDMVRDDLSNLQVVPESCRSLIARTVRLCNVVDQDGSVERLQRLERIDNVILDYNFQIPMSEWDFGSLTDGYLSAYMHLRSGSICLRDVDRNILDERMCRCAVYAKPDDLEFVPASFCSMDMADYAISYGSPENLQYISFSLQTPEQVQLAVSRDPMTIRYANPELVTFDLASSAVIRNGLAIQFIQHFELTSQQRTALVQLALVQNPDAVKLIPKSMLCPEIISIAVRKNYECFTAIPESLRTPDMMLRMLFINPCLGKYLPQRLLVDREFMKKASLIDNGWKQYAPELISLTAK